MRIDCLHGYFLFNEQKAGEVSDFVSLFGFDLVQKDGYFTFSSLEDAPDFSLPESTFLGAATTELFEGKPWEVMRENELVYNFATDQVVSRDTISNTVKLSQSGKFYVSSGLIVPGSLTAEGLRVTDYAAWFSKELMTFRYSGVTLV